MGGHEKSITKAQKLILLGGGIQCLPPTEKGLIEISLKGCKLKNLNLTTCITFSDIFQTNDPYFNKQKHLTLSQ